VSYTRTSEFWRTNVTYVRLKRLELAYALPQSLLGSFGLQSARVYLSGANLLTFSNLSHIHLDPEVAQDSGLRYPTQRVVNLGFSTTLGARNQPGT
jgi:hypothetical protein